MVGSFALDGCTMVLSMERTLLERRLLREQTLTPIWPLLSEGPWWIVGGWIRDRALNREPSDLDLVVAGDGRELIHKLAKGLGLKAHAMGQPGRRCWLIAAPTGHSIKLPGGHGSLTGISKIEIWPLDNLSLEDDIYRRDFTVNAMLWQIPDGPLLDPTGGLEDLRAGLLRAIRKENLSDDPVRLLRATRLIAGMPKFDIEEQTRAWIKELAPLLGTAPAERIGGELMRICRAIRPARGLGLSEDLGLLEHRLAAPSRDVDRDHGASVLSYLDRGLPVGKAARKPESYLAWLVSRLSIKTRAELSPFCWPRSSADMAFTASRDERRARKLVDMGWRDRREAIDQWGDAFPAVLALAGARDLAKGGSAGAWRSWWRQYRRFIARQPRPEMPLGADEVGRICGLAPGPELGRTLKRLHTKMIRREILSRAGAIRWLRLRSHEAPDDYSESSAAGFSAGD